MTRVTRLRRRATAFSAARSVMLARLSPCARCLCAMLDAVLRASRADALRATRQRRRCCRHAATIIITPLLPRLTSFRLITSRMPPASFAHTLFYACYFLFRYSFAIQSAFYTTMFFMRHATLRCYATARLLPHDITMPDCRCLTGEPAVARIMPARAATCRARWRAS